jgi:hypothetical protein
MDTCQIVAAFTVIMVVYLIFYVLLPTLVKRFIAERKGKFTDLRFAGFVSKINPKGDAVYKTHYLDERGNEHEGYVAINLFLGAYLVEDKITKNSDTEAKK